MTTSGPASVPNLRFRQALDSVRAELAEIPEGDLNQINLDIPAAVMITMGCAQQLRDYRPRIAGLPDFDIDAFDKIEVYALALGQSHAQYLAASAPPEPVQELYEELSQLREVLVSDVTALAKRKLLDGRRLGELKGPPGYKNVAFDVLLLCALIRDHWTAVSGRTAVAVSEIDRAEVLADRLATAVAVRDRGAAATSEAAELRIRAFTRFVSTYDQARRAISYLRWTEEDVDTIIPTLYGGKGKRKHDVTAEAAAKMDEGAATPPPAAVAAGPVTTTPTAAATPLTAAPIAAAAAPSATAGMPDDDPFH